MLSILVSAPGKTSVSLVSEPVTDEAREDALDPGIALLTCLTVCHSGRTWTSCPTELGGPEELASQVFRLKFMVSYKIAAKSPGSLSFGAQLGGQSTKLAKSVARQVTAVPFRECK